MDSTNIVSTSQWIKFFTNAGLPPSVAANYAILFTDHRIQMDMLLDLSKEYLYDMGIRVLGDVIAILKYAKEAHAQATKEKVLGGNSSTEHCSPMLRSQQKSTLATRILDRYTKQSPRTSSTNSAMNSSERESRVAQPVSKGNTLVSLKRKSESTRTVQPQKVRRVPPEDEGAYSIKMPLGTTERTRKILQQAQQAQVKKSVFSRLGDNIVSSSTDISKGKVGTSSVFDRLGPSKDQVQNQLDSSTGHNELTFSQSGPPLQYQGVLKNAGSAKRITPMNQTVTITRVISRNGVQTKTTNTTGKKIILTKKKLAAGKVTRQVGMPGTLILKKSLAEATTNAVKPQGINIRGAVGTKIVLKKTDVKSRLGMTAGTKGAGTFRSSTKLSAGPVNTLRMQSATAKTLNAGRRTVFDRLGPSGTNKL